MYRVTKRTFFDKFCQNFWQLLKTFDNFWQILINVDKMSEKRSTEKVQNNVKNTKKHPLKPPVQTLYIHCSKRSYTMCFVLFNPFHPGAYRVRTTFIRGFYKKTPFFDTFFSSPSGSFTWIFSKIFTKILLFLYRQRRRKKLSKIYKKNFSKGSVFTCYVPLQ